MHSMASKVSSRAQGGNVQPGNKQVSKYAVHEVVHDLKLGDTAVIQI